MSDFLQNWLVIVNPNAGSRKGARVWPSISKILIHEGFTFQVRFTTAPLDATRFVQDSVHEGYRKFILVGGDGTLQEAANGILLQQLVPQNEILTAMIPVGTGNDWCRMYRIPTSPEEAVKVILSRKEYTQDVCKASYTTDNGIQSRFFINLAGIGFDAEVIRRIIRSKQKGGGGKLQYIWHLLVALIKLRSTNILVKMDQVERKGSFFSISLGMGRFKGGGMMTAPKAIPGDGLLDVTLIGRMGQLEVIRSLPLLFNGKIETHRKIELLRTKNAVVESDTPVYIEADGELLGKTPVRFEVIPAALRILIGEKPS